MDQVLALRAEQPSEARVPILHTRVPDVQQQTVYPIGLAAGPAAAAAATERAIAVMPRNVKVIACRVFPDTAIAQDAGDPSVLTIQVGATVIGTADNSGAGGITLAAGASLTLDAAKVDLDSGDEIKFVATNPGAGAQDLSSTAFSGYITVEPR